MKSDKIIVEEMVENGVWMTLCFHGVADYSELAQKSIEVWHLYNRRYSWDRIIKYKDKVEALLKKRL